MYLPLYYIISIRIKIYLIYYSQHMLNHYKQTDNLNTKHVPKIMSSKPPFKNHNRIK